MRKETRGEKKYAGLVADWVLIYEIANSQTENNRVKKIGHL